LREPVSVNSRTSLHSAETGLGRIASFAEIAERESRLERHIRLLASLAFLSPRIIAAIVDGTAPADLTVTGLAKALPCSWAEQERAIARKG
jgi:site-specific DNA recombinase